MITLTDVTKTYKGGVQALRGVTLGIEPRGMFGLLGENGAGKSTLMRIVAGILEPTSGQVTAFGHDMSTAKGQRTVRGLLGYLPQHLGLYPNLTGREFLDYMAVLKQINNKAARQHEVERALELVHLTDKADSRLKTYSGGMQRRIGIAQALLGSPKLVIVDEPTTGLDPEERIRFRNLLAEIASRAAVILSTHIVEDIGHSCTDLAVIHKGGVLYRGQPGDLIRQAQGHVWTIVNEQPAEHLTVVATRHHADGVHYRVIGQPDNPAATLIQPTLEDAYMFLMQRKEVSV